MMYSSYLTDFSSLGFIQNIRLNGTFTYSDAIGLTNLMKLPSVQSISYVKFFYSSTSKIVVNNFYLS